MPIIYTIYIAYLRILHETRRKNKLYNKIGKSVGDIGIPTAVGAAGRGIVQHPSCQCRLVSELILLKSKVRKIRVPDENVDRQNHGGVENMNIIIH